MCGIVGVLELKGGPPPEEQGLRRMLAMIRHRGPDQFGIFRDATTGLGSARLCIQDPEHGQQPMSNEAGTLWIVFNGEVYNHPELREDLKARGHRFVSHCDTEVVVHAYEEWGSGCLSRFNGQFAFAIWDTQESALFLARDRLGVRPLFYTLTQDAFLFGSEVKAILADPRVQAQIDLAALGQVFTFWSTLAPSTLFKGILELPPGHAMTLRQGAVQLEPYWEITFPPAGTEPHQSRQDYLEGLRDLLVDATRIRLRADVPVGAYLSGGLDSSTITAIIGQCSRLPLETFSIAIEDPDFDERRFQMRAADYLGTHHHMLQVSHEDIGRAFPEVVWHAETPLLRTSPVPMFLLSRLVQGSGLKVVLTGEGADEFLGGYDLFKEAKVRRFWAGLPTSKVRPALFKRFYPWISGLANGNEAYLAAFFGRDLADTQARDYSHSIRWRTTSRTQRFFSEEVRQSLSPGTHLALDYPEAFSSWDPLDQAAYLEASIFLPQHLLSSQGDRMAMAHAVEGRFPFLDHRVVEFCNALPPGLKLRGLTEKFALRQVAGAWLPADLAQRPKQPYRAPIHRSFLGDVHLDYVQELLSAEALSRTGLFQPLAVARLKEKVESGYPLGETDDMALAGILSTQLLVRQFITDFRVPAPLDQETPVHVVALGPALAGA